MEAKDINVGSLFVAKLPVWETLYAVSKNTACGSWADEFQFMVVEANLHQGCDDFNYKVKLTPKGKHERIGVERSWYTSDIIERLLPVSSLEEGMELVEKLNKKDSDAVVVLEERSEKQKKKCKRLKRIANIYKSVLGNIDKPYLAAVRGSIIKRALAHK